MTLSSPSKKAATSERAKKLAREIFDQQKDYDRGSFPLPKACLAALIDRCLKDAKRETLERWGIHRANCGGGMSRPDSVASLTWEQSKHKWQECTCGLADEIRALAAGEDEDGL